MTIRKDFGDIIRRPLMEFLQEAVTSNKEKYTSLLKKTEFKFSKRELQEQY